MQTKAMIALFGLFAEVERDLIAERTKEGLAAARAKDMHFQYPHLSLAQIRAAFAYYSDHQAELDAEDPTAMAGGECPRCARSDFTTPTTLASAGETPVSVRLYYRDHLRPPTHRRLSQQLGNRSFTVTA